MKTGEIITSDEKIKKILAANRTVAVLGLSPKQDRASYRVAEYLQKKGYRIIPVRPAQNEILGETAYAGLPDVKDPVDIVDVFRRSEQVLPHAKEAIALDPKPKVFWMQLGIENQEAADLLIQAGIDVVMDKCIKVEHAKHF